MEFTKDTLIAFNEYDVFLVEDQETLDALRVDYKYEFDQSRTTENVRVLRSVQDYEDYLTELNDQYLKSQREYQVNNFSLKKVTFIDGTISYYRKLYSMPETITALIIVAPAGTESEFDDLVEF